MAGQGPARKSSGPCACFVLEGSQGASRLVSKMADRKETNEKGLDLEGDSYGITQENLTTLNEVSCWGGGLVGVCGEGRSWVFVEV